MKLTKLLLGTLLACSFASGVGAQSSPGLTYGQVPTAGQWNSFFSAKQDVLGYTPLNQAGGTMLGPLKTAAPTTATAGFSILQGVAPNTPQNGDIWLTSTGLYYKAGNIIFGPIGAGTIVGPNSSTVGHVATFGNTSGTSVIDSGKSLPSGAIVGTTDVQTLPNKTLPSPVITGGANFNGSTSGTTVLQASPTAAGTITIPSGTDTLLTANGAATLTNKSIDASQINSGTLPASRLSGAYPSVTQVNSALFGDAGSNPYIGGNGNVPFSLQANGYEFLRGFDVSGSGRMRVWSKQTADTDAVTWLNLSSFGVGVEGTNNGIVGVVVNNLSPSTTAFPTGVTGAAYNKSSGNTAFGVYGEGHTTTNGLATASEFAAFQDAAPAPTAYPFNNTIGTPQYLAKSIQATAGTKTAVTVTGTTTSASTSITGLSSTTGLFVGQFLSGSGIPAKTSIVSINTGASSMVISHPATASGSSTITAKSPAGVSLEINQEGSTSGLYQYGIAVPGAAVAQYSYYQDCQGDDCPSNGIYMGYAGSGTGLRLRALGTSSWNQNNNFTMFQIDSAIKGDGVASIRQDGDIYGHAWISNQKTGPTISSCTGAGTGGTCTLDSGSNDGAGTITITAGTGTSAAGGGISLSFNIPVGGNSSGCLFNNAAGSGQWQAGSSFNITAQNASGVTFNWLNGPPTGTALTASSTYKINYFCPGH